MSGAGSLDIQTFLNSGDQEAAIISTRYDEWRGYRREKEAIWEEVRKYVHATDSRCLENGVPQHDNSTHIPVITQIADNLEANYEAASFPHDDWLRFEALSPEAANAELRTKIEAYLKTKHRLSGFYMEMKKCRKDWIYTGNAFARVDYVKRTRTNRRTGDEEPAYVGPVVRRISPYDIVFSPFGDSFESVPFILRSVYTLGELARMAEESNEEWPAEALQRAREYRTAYNGAGSADRRRISAAKFDGFGPASAYLASGYVEILEFYGDMYIEESGEFLKNHRIVIVDRKWVVDKGPVESSTGRPHIYHVPWRVQPDNLWGQGPLEQLVGMQYRINHLENSRADAYDQQIDPDLVFRGNVDVMRDGARNIYISDDSNGDVRRLVADTSIMNADLQISTLRQLMEELVGAPRQALGIRTPGEKTAHEVQTLENNAGRTFQNKISYFERYFVEPIVNAELEEAAANLTSVDVVQAVSDEDGVVDFLDITESDLTSNGKLVPIGARHFARQAQILQNLTGLYQGVLADPGVNMHISKKTLAKVVVEDVMNYSNLGIYRPFVGVMEQAEAQQYMNAAEQEIGEQEARRAGLDGGEGVPISPDQQLTQ